MAAVDPCPCLEHEASVKRRASPESKRSSDKPILKRLRSQVNVAPLGKERLCSNVAELDEMRRRAAELSSQVFRASSTSETRCDSNETVAPHNNRSSTSDKFKCPVATASEVSQFTVAFADIHTNLLPVMKEHGVVIVTGVADAQTCKELEDLFAQDLQELVDKAAVITADTRVQAVAAKDACDPRLWPMPSLKLLGTMERSQYRGLSQGRFAWAVRSLSNIRSCYGVLHGTDDLVCSCDNTFYAPTAHAKQTQNKMLPHVDQNVHDERWRINDWDCYQGIFYVWSSCGTEHASTTVVWPGSHCATYDVVMADAKVQSNGKKGCHFTQIAKTADLHTSKQLLDGWRQHCKRVPVQAGALLLFNSKTIHQGWRGGPRLAQPVCWEPVSRRDEQALMRKMRLAALGLPSTHWASLGLPHNPSWTSIRSRAAPTQAQLQKDGVALPLKSSLRPVTLVDSADFDALWKAFGKLPWMNRLSPDLCALLHRSIQEKYKALL